MYNVQNEINVAQQKKNNSGILAKNFSKYNLFLYMFVKTTLLNLKCTNSIIIYYHLRITHKENLR